jgi:hypothetical protein
MQDNQDNPASESKTRKRNIKEIAALLRSTETMAARFAQRVQERVGQPVSNAEILDAMQQMSAKRLSMDKVVAKVRQQITS